MVLTVTGFAVLPVALVHTPQGVGRDKVMPVEAEHVDDGAAQRRSASLTLLIWRGLLAGCSDAGRRGDDDDDDGGAA
jgi:hypothetical protein